MKRERRILGMSLSLLFTLAACGGGEASGLCEKLSECNALAGQSVAECTDTVQTNIDALSATRKTDCEASINACLQLASCDNFIACQLACN